MDQTDWADWIEFWTPLNEWLLEDNVLVIEIGFSCGKTDVQVIVYEWNARYGSRCSLFSEMLDTDHDYPCLDLELLLIFDCGIMRYKISDSWLYDFFTLLRMELC